MRKLFIIPIVFLFIASCNSQPQVLEEPYMGLFIEPEIAAAIEILEPEFEVVSIIVLQSDLVVTEFETVLRITNPNIFAVEVTSITYELYGNGLLWAEGIRADILHVPAESSYETTFRFEMNFINMPRRLLDDIIALRRVNYRFMGEAEIKLDFLNIESFHTSFDYSGISDVMQRSQR